VQELGAAAVGREQLMDPPHAETSKRVIALKTIWNTFIFSLIQKKALRRRQFAARCIPFIRSGVFDLSKVYATGYKTNETSNH
jgi:hypothetical protein